MMFAITSGLFGKRSEASQAGIRRALFLDRDGVINVDYGYVHSVDRFVFVEGIFELAKAARTAGYQLVVVTNQAGIARGYYSEATFHTLTEWMCKEFERRGALIDKVYFSPFHPTEGIGGYRKEESTRKPGPGMLLMAQRELDLSLDESILVGDKPTDIMAGIAAGVGANILLSNERPAELAGLAYLLANDLADVIPFLEDVSMTSPVK